MPQSLVEEVVLRFHVMSPILGECIEAILIPIAAILIWLFVEYTVAQIAGVQKDFIAIFKIIKS